MRLDIFFVARIMVTRSRNLNGFIFLNSYPLILVEGLRLTLECVRLIVSNVAPDEDRIKISASYHFRVVCNKASKMPTHADTHAGYVFNIGD